MDTACKYSGEQLGRLRDDPEFNRRIGADEELARLFNPRCNDTDVRAELANGLGMTRRIAGVEVPPVTLGMIGLLTAVGNEFVKVKPDWARGFEYQLAQFQEVLFVLAHGSKAVIPFADVFRHRKTLDAWRKDAASSPHIAQACLDAERQANAAMRLWDGAVLAWAEKHIRLEADETWPAAMANLDDWLVQGLTGLKLFPNVQAPDADKEGSAKATSPFGWMRKWRPRLSRLLVRVAAGLILRRFGGQYRFLP